MWERELEKINQPILDLLREKLLGGFLNRKGQPIIKVEQIFIYDLPINEDKSEIREIVFVNRIHFGANVLVALGDDGSTTDTLNIYTDRGLSLEYDSEHKCYRINEERSISFIDNSQ